MKQSKIFNLLACLIAFQFITAFASEEFLIKTDKLSNRYLEDKIMWKCETFGKVIDSNDNPLQNIKISGKLFLLNQDTKLTFYKQLEETQTGASGDYKIEYEVEDNKNIVTIKEELSFELTNFGQKQIETKSVYLKQGTYFKMNLNVKMKFLGSISGILTQGKTVIKNAEISAQNQETKETVTTTSNDKGEFSFLIEAKQNEESEIIMTVTPKNQKNFRKQEFQFVLGPKNSYLIKDEKVQILENQEIRMKGQVLDKTGKPAKNSKIFIKVGNKIIEMKTDNDGKYDKIIKLDKDIYKKGVNLETEILSKNDQQLGTQNQIIVWDQQTYNIPIIKITNEIDYTIKISKLLDDSKKEIREDDIKIKAQIGKTNFILERKKIKKADEESKQMYYYEGIAKVERKGKELEGNIIISGGKYYIEQKLITKENIEKLEKTYLTTEIKKTTLNNQKKKLELKGHTLSLKGKKKIVDAQITAVITCESCLNKKTKHTSIVKTNTNGEFTLKIIDALELKQQSTIQLTVSSSEYLEKTVSKQFNGELKELEKLKDENWEILLTEKQFLVIEGTVKDRLSSKILASSQIAVTILGIRQETTTDAEGNFEIKQELHKEKSKFEGEVEITPQSTEYNQFKQTIEVTQKKNYKLIKTFELLTKSIIIFEGNVAKQEEIKKVQVVDASIEITISNKESKTQKFIAKSDEKGSYFIQKSKHYFFKFFMNKVQIITYSKIQFRTKRQQKQKRVIISDKRKFSLRKDNRNTKVQIHLLQQLIKMIQQSVINQNIL